jgi:hypothetical protein
MDQSTIITKREITDARRQELKNVAQFLAVNGVRNNTGLENLHCGISPRSKTGDYSDIKVVSPYGEIEWNQLSRINDEEMRALMLSVEHAIEVSLATLEVLSEKDKELALEFFRAQRSYDC